MFLVSSAAFLCILSRLELSVSLADDIKNASNSSDGQPVWTLWWLRHYSICNALQAAVFDGEEEAFQAIMNRKASYFCPSLFTLSLTKTSFQEICFWMFGFSVFSVPVVVVFLKFESLAILWDKNLKLG